MGNHRDSSFVRYLQELGFADASMDEHHRVGPWLFIDVTARTYKYCPHYGCGPGDDTFADVHFSEEEFKSVYAAIESARARKAAMPRWEDRIKGSC